LRGISRAGVYVIIAVVVIAAAVGLIAWIQGSRQPAQAVQTGPKPTPTMATAPPQCLR